MLKISEINLTKLNNNGIDKKYLLLKQNRCINNILTAKSFVICQKYSFAQFISNELR